MNNILLQLCRFGLVGLIAASVHFYTVIFLVQNTTCLPLTANVFGFLCGFQVSYWGHRYYTFATSATAHHLAIPKLFIVQLVNFAANETLFYGFLSFHLPYPIALILVLTILPFFTFIYSKRWVFQ